MTIFGNFDVALISLYVFWIFFAGLIFYLRLEDRREGYPLESEIDGKPIETGFIYTPGPKVFKLPHGHGTTSPGRIDNYDIKAEPTEPWPGAPLEPTGNPMIDAVGPAAYAFRADKPDLTHEGHDKIVPLRVARDFNILKNDADPRGMDVIAGDGEVAGKVKDVWVDRSESLIRYLEIELPQTAPPVTPVASEGDGQPVHVQAVVPQTVLAPMTLCVVKRKQNQVKIKIIESRHFADVPKLKNPDQVTLLEEDKISAYYGGGQLYTKLEYKGAV